MTPIGIVEAALDQGLGIVAITDHNQVGNVEAALSSAAGTSLLVVPGTELSTPNGHLLLYFPTLDALQRFYGRLDLSQDLRVCNQTIEQCLTLAGSFGGFGMVAHIDAETGLERMMPRFDHFKENVICHESLLALEVSGTDAETWYTGRDQNSDRKRLLKLRSDKHEEDDSYELPRVMGSDAHSLVGLGKNAKGLSKLTRIKMETRSFDGLRVALLDPTARVRLEDMLPPAVAHFVGIHLKGGFLDSQTVRFSRNLNCIIGGRGTGKSTLLESIRAAAGGEAREGLSDSDVWPDQITLVYEDQAGRGHVFSKAKFYPVVNVTDPEGITRIPIESYGQGETAETIQHCDKDPAVLLAFLDGFVDLDQVKRDDEQLREEALENQTTIERLVLDLTALPDMQKAKAHAEAQLQALKAKDAAAVVDLEEKLARGRRFKKELIENLNRVFKSYKEALADTQISTLIGELDSSQLVVGQAEFEKVKGLIDKFLKAIERLSSDVQAACKETIDGINKELKQWTSREVDVQDQIDAIRKDLEKRGIRLDIAFIRKITNDVADFTGRLAELKTKQGLLVNARNTRRQLVQRRRELRSRIFVSRKAFADELNRNLLLTVVDYVVIVRFREGCLSEEFENLIRDQMKWRTSQVPKARLIAAHLSPFQMLDAINQGETAKITEIKAPDGSRAFTEGEARFVFETLSKESVKHEIERCAFEDRPEISVTKEVQFPDGTKQHQRRDFSKLSLGQQQSVLLSILLFSKSNDPLVIDQPEDNLDSEFIYKTFVKSLRRVKEARQVIVVTHNANIAVLGDAELIIPLRASSEKSVIRDRGSIDSPATKDLTCTILEGSREAFKKRQRMYRHGLHD